MKRLVVLVVFAVVAVMVQVNCAMAETKRSEGMVTPVKEDQTIKGQGVVAPSMKQVLFNRKGFDMDWFCGGKSGRSVVFFREDGKKIVADIRVVDIKDVDINNPIHYGSESCTTEAKLTDNGIIFNGCNPASRDIPLAYDPLNEITPFKGSGVNCPSIALSPR
jgi:hypothetical protein